ncbi:NADPH-dependent F420 reductase [Dyella sp. 2RAB6]|uniref:NADPH-dependent F420 reductase n=1 Tax=Dyella sp. 2RAB6 TaxID=3232992 RepID=UPI003F8E456D
MKIGIIGTGNIGGTIARKLAASGHRVWLANSRGPDTVQAFATEIGATAVDVPGAARGVDAIILAIPLPAMAHLPKDLFEAVPAEVPIIDTSNYYPGLRDPQIAEIESGLPESVWVSKQLGRPVIKAFNNVLAYTLAELGRSPCALDRLAMAVAGDDAKAKQIAMALVNEVGFDPVDAGSLEESWRQQPATPAYCCDYDAETMRKGLDAAVKGLASEKLRRMGELFAKLGPDPTHRKIVAMNRSLNPL